MEEKANEDSWRGRPHPVQISSHQTAKRGRRQKLPWSFLLSVAHALTRTAAFSGTFFCLFVCLFLLWRPAPSAVLNSSPATNTETHTLTVHVTYCTMPRKAGGRDCGYENKGNLCSFINRKINVYFYSYGLAISCLYLPPCHCFTFQRTCTTCHDFCKAVCCFLDHL